MRDKYGAHHCTWCGESIAPRPIGGGRYEHYCSLNCVAEDLLDAQKERDIQRAGWLYNVRVRWRRRLGLPSLSEVA